ncbi:YidC/Oxa1 family membrane protein insertase [Sphaerochaeta sp.]|uniref:YidC/Oxa1 family membrane protein insertase n=1 Tax=Sphaerochaeta sp. TaxID=1972642 RepID=UPI002FC8F047
MGAFVYNIVISPIELLVELSFVLFYKAFDNLGLAIAAISVLISILTLPLYYIADQLQKKERDQRIAIQPGIDRIKAIFTGDEQYMILSTYYRQNHYHPAYVLRNSVSLLIQVPFFIAAYHFLSNLPQLQGERFLFISNLGKADGLLQWNGLAINLLPFVMTLINIVSGIIYTKGFPLRDKLQLYGMAGLFLILLYNSPSGLVYYWILNNLFSLIKNIFYKLRHPMKVLYILGVASSALLSAILMIIHPNLPKSIKLILSLSFLAVSCAPLLNRLRKFLYKSCIAAYAAQGTISFGCMHRHLYYFGFFVA